LSDNRVSTLEKNLTDISNNRLDAVEGYITDLSDNRVSTLETTLSTLSISDVSGITDELSKKQDEIKTTSNLSLATLDATGQITCGDLTIDGQSIQTYVDNASGSGLTKSDIDGKQDILTAGNNISIVTTTDTTTNITTNTILATNEVTQDDLTSALSLKQQTINASVQLTTNTISSSNITGRIGTTISAPTISATEKLLVEETDINTLIDNKVSSSTPTSAAVYFKARGGLNFEINSGDILEYNTIILNEGGGYDDTTFEFTAPVTGLYHFILSFYSYAAYATEVEMYQNDGVERVIEILRGDGFKKYFGSVITFCNEGDEIYSKCTLNSLLIIDGSRDGNGDPLCNFSGFLITQMSSGTYG